MKKRIIIIGVVLLTICLVTTLIGTFASDSTVVTTDNIHTITLTGSNGEITVPAGTSKTVIYQITNTNKGVVKYGVAYSGDNITVKVYNDTIDPETGLIDYGENKFVKLYIENTGETDSTATIKTVLGYEFGGELEGIVPTGYTLVTEVYTPSKPVNLLAHITSLYLNNKDENLVTNNGISYGYASSVSLMNDRLGSMNTDVDGGNIRYYGADPNNYIYFNCETYPDTNCETWRIIGLFKDVEVVQDDGTIVTKDMVKIANASTIGKYAWDNKTINIGSSTSNAGSNDWTDARLMMLLNDGYEEGVTNDEGDVIYGYEGSLYWNAKNGTCYAEYSGGTKTCDFTSTSTTPGLKNDETRNMIQEVVWNLGGFIDNSVYSNQLYEYERGTTVYTGRATEWEGHVALMYPSDYGYATDFNLCTSDLENYLMSSSCLNNDWLFNGADEHLLTPVADSKYGGWYRDSVGHVNGGLVSNADDVRPVLYLDSVLDIESGNTGSSTDPYRIVVK